DICLMGTGCITSQGNRNLADFFVITIDSTGAAEIVYDDTSNGLIQTAAGLVEPPHFVDHPGAGVITIARQSSGLGLFGTAVTGPSNAPVGGLNDPPGDALFPVIGGSDQRGTDVVGTSMQLSPDGGTLNETARVIDLSNPCSVTIAVRVGDIGMTPAKAATSLLEEVGGYALAATIPEGAENNATAESDTVPLEIDGVCCYNFKAAVQNGPPPPCRTAAGNGDINSANQGKASFSIDKTHCHDIGKGTLQAQDASANMNFQATEFQSVVFN